jgi:hypothetical protein
MGKASATPTYQILKNANANNFVDMPNAVQSEIACKYG